MSEDGYVLTKASSCVGARWAETYEGMKYSLKIKKRDEESDFALYKIEKNNTKKKIQFMGIDDYNFHPFDKSNSIMMGDRGIAQ